MSVCDRHGRQLDPDEWDASGTDPMPVPLTPDDARTVARAIVRDERIPEGERMRLTWAVLDASAGTFAEAAQ